MDVTKKASPGAKPASTSTEIYINPRRISKLISSNNTISGQRGIAPTSTFNGVFFENNNTRKLTKPILPPIVASPESVSSDDSPNPEATKKELHSLPKLPPFHVNPIGFHKNYKEKYPGLQLQTSVLTQIPDLDETPKPESIRVQLQKYSKPKNEVRETFEEFNARMNTRPDGTAIASETFLERAGYFKHMTRPEFIAMKESEVATGRDVFKEKRFEKALNLDLKPGTLSLRNSTRAAEEKKRQELAPLIEKSVRARPFIQTHPLQPMQSLITPRKERRPRIEDVRFAPGVHIGRDPKHFQHPDPNEQKRSRSKSGNSNLPFGGVKISSLVARKVMENQGKRYVSPDGGDKMSPLEMAMVDGLDAYKISHHLDPFDAAKFKHDKQ